MKVFCKVLLSVLFACSVSVLKNPAHGQADDPTELVRQAQLAYFTVPSYAIRHTHGKAQYLFLAPDPKREHDDALFGFDTAKLVLAEHSENGQTKVLWQYDLPQGGLSVCWRSTGTSAEKDGIFVNTYRSLCLNFEAHYGFLPHKISMVSLSSDDYTLIMDSGKVFISPVQTGAQDDIFYTYHSPNILDPASGSVVSLDRLPDFREGSSNYLAVGDVDGDGTIDIIGDSGRETSGQNKQIFPSVFHAWRYIDKHYVQVYQSPPHESVVTRSISLHYAKTVHLAILAQEAHFPGLKNAAQETRYALHLYQWDGKAITELANTVGLLPGQLYGQFAAADLRGDGVQEVVAVFVKGTSPRIAVLEYKNSKFLEVWESPPLDYHVEFGRPDHYLGPGEQVPLTDPDTGGKRLFRFAAGKYVGWERMLTPPPPPAPPAPTLDVRFHWEERDMLGLQGVPKNVLVLDGNALIQVFPNTREINAEYRTQQIQQRILDLAKQSFPAAQVVARKVGDEDEEPKREIVAGKTVIITLTESEAKTVGKPLAAYAQDWVTAVKTALTTLAKPPK